MPSVRLSFSGYQSSNENGGGGHAWQNVPGAGASASGAGAHDTRDPNSADMNWIRSQGDGARGSATIPAGSTITGIVVGFQALQNSGAQTGGSCVCGIFKAGALVASKSVSLPQGGSVGPFGASNDLWGLGGVVSPTYFTNMYFGLHLNFPTITADINMYAWNGYMDIYYNDPTPVPTSISVGAGNNLSAQVSTQFPGQMYAIVRDQGGNTMAGIGVTFTLPASGASGGFNSLGGPKTATAVTNSSGGAVSPFFWANGTTGNWQPVADVTGSSPLVFVFFNMTNTAPPPVLVPSSITIVQGGTQQAPVLTQFALRQKVQVRDQFSAVMNNVEINWTQPGSGARGTYTGYAAGATAITYTDVTGVAEAPALTANNVVGAWTENAFPTGFAGVVAPFALTNLANNLPPTPTVLQIVSGNSQSAALSSNFPTAVIVQVIDQYGAPYTTGASVTATIPNSGNGSFLTGGGQSKTVTSDSSGYATFGTIVAGATVSAGWNMTVTCTGTSGTSVGTFKNIDATVVTSLALISGGSQTAPINTTFSAPLKVRATNGLGNPVQNFSVTFTAPGTAASCKFTGALTQVVLTLSDGTATTVNPVATATEGSYNVVASGSGVTSLNIPLQNGNNYGAEVCTSVEVTTGGFNQITSNSGSGVFFANPDSCDDAAGGGTHADITMAGSLDVSRALFMRHPASWAAIPDDARISKVVLNLSKKYSGTVNTPTAQVCLYNNNTLITPSGTVTVSGITTSFTSSAATFTTAALTMTGAQIKNTLSGPGIIVTGGLSAPNGEIQFNGCTIQVCWQPLIPPPVRPALPLPPCNF